MKMNGQVFRVMQRLKKVSIPIISLRIVKRYNGYYAMCLCDSWAAKKAMHPFDGLNIDFSLWDSKKRGTAEIAFKIR